ncbi:complement factor I isoform X1 [Carassius gibelio]|uniref:complement factor I isoform X1 n=1 Tax=Carassius gibelio TaxID=101364 RepID=UPI0022781F58|nr:complement factor I isoform X1 [Carassius gibelio]
MRLSQGQDEEKNRRIMRAVFCFMCLLFQTALNHAEVPDEDFLGPAQCLDQKYTRLSCSKVFCPPWRRCIAGQCVCKTPNKCPQQKIKACTLDGSEYYSMCQANAISCRTKSPTFSHFSQTCKAEDKVDVMVSGSNNVVEIKTKLGKMLVCGNGWNMAAANVVCRNAKGVDRGAEVASNIPYGSLDEAVEWSKECMRVRCTGSELSLAECTIYNPEPIKTGVAAIKCYEETPCADECKKFLCVNGKCLIHGKPCDGVDDCGDNSDEMCCQKCQGQAFLCKSGVCVPHYAVNDGIRDCLGGEDELEVTETDKAIENTFTDPMSEIREMRSSAESQLQCGIPNRQDDHDQRWKRSAGWEETLPTQIQWQVAIQDEGSIRCGGVYLGGCWVLTAAHCVRPKPKSFRIKFSLWKKHRSQSTTDIVPVKNIIIHHEYNPQTYANDIALVQLEEVQLSDKCMLDNSAVRAVCVPWSTQQFQPNDTCTVSGWGRGATLKWANVTLVGDCEHYFKDRFLAGMECAGDLDGRVDSCQGDSGGPLVCTDTSGLSYVWGIMSRGNKCSEPNHLGIYTKVAHYFEWIRSNTGWPAVTKFNQ